MRSPAAIQIVKEGRAVAPVVIASAVAMGMLAPPIAGQLIAPAALGIDLGLWVYTIATIAVGALVVGHEFSSGTLLSLLAQPIPRARLGLWKLIVLIAGAAMLALVARTTVFGASRSFGALEVLRMDFLILPLACAVCLAPWITQLCRNTLAGAIFTAAVPAVLWITSGIVATLVAGRAPDQPLEFDAFRIAVLRLTSLIVCAAGAFAGWRSFLRLEAREPQAFIAIRAVRRSGDTTDAWTRTPSRRPALVNLLGKELRIQQMTFVLAVAYVFVGFGMRMTMSAAQGPFALEALTTGYVVFAALLAGSLSSAEDRQSGALEAQLLLPMPAFWQWIVKIVVAIAVATAVIVLLPRLLGTSADTRPNRLLPVLIAAFAAGVYFSSLSATAVRALMLAAAGAIGIAFAGALAMRLAESIARALATPVFGPAGPYFWNPYRYWLRDAPWISSLGLVALTAIVLAYRNFRQSDRSRRQLIRQIAVLLLCFFVPTFGSSVVGAYRGAQQQVKATAFRAEFMRMENDRIRADLGVAGGAYYGTRFDWAGSISSLTWNGHSFFGKWSDIDESRRHDFITGPVEDFSSLGYDEAPAGGTFVRIGVGVLRKPQEPAYDPFKTYDIVNYGGRQVRRGPGWFEYWHILGPMNGYAYRYVKTLRLSGDTLTIEHVLENQGTRRIETNVYNHNFFMLDDQPTGPDTSITLPFDVTATGSLNGMIETRGKQIAYLKELQAGESLHTELKGYGPKVSDYDIRVENRKTGAGVRQVGDRPLSKLVLWSPRSTVCPEAYVDIAVDPGQTTTWKIVYTFYSTK